MSALKFKANDLYKDVRKEQDKKIVETLIKDLNDKILKDEKTAKKAALILEAWLKKTKP
ncbi:MAG TPA: hypothetical protein VKZ84_05435 [Bacteriovoracaceae bacterium]|nr:hypothetical protein [Bacteriovoracaceae bacterium]